MIWSYNDSWKDVSMHFWLMMMLCIETSFQPLYIIRSKSFPPVSLLLTQLKLPLYFDIIWCHHQFWLPLSTRALFFNFQLVMKDLLQTYLPKLSRHLDFYGIDIGLVTFNWCLTIFVDAVPATVSDWIDTNLDFTNLSGRKPALFFFWDFVGTAWFKSDKISKKDFSGWRPTTDFLYLFLFHSLLRLPFFSRTKFKASSGKMRKSWSLSNAVVRFVCGNFFFFLHSIVYSKTYLFIFKWERRASQPNLNLRRLCPARRKFTRGHISAKYATTKMMASWRVLWHFDPTPSKTGGKFSPCELARSLGPHPKQFPYTPARAALAYSSNILKEGRWDTGKSLKILCVSPRASSLFQNVYFFVWMISFDCTKVQLQTKCDRGLLPELTITNSSCYY